MVLPSQTIILPETGPIQRGLILQKDFSPFLFSNNLSRAQRQGLPCEADFTHHG